MIEYTEVLYREKQKMGSTWIWFFIVPTSLLLLIIFSYGMYQQFVRGKPWGDEPLSDSGLAILGGSMIALSLSLPYIFSRMRLEVTVYPGRIEYRFFPFQIKNRSVPLERIASYEGIEVRPIRDFGGFGIRRRKGEWGYIADGGGGVRLRLKDGSSLVFSSADPSAFLLALDSATGGRRTY